MDINSMGPASGRILREDSTAINRANAFKQIKDGIVSHVTMDSYRAAIIDGNAYTVSFSDPTGITAGTSYYYIVKNTSTTKSAWVRPIEFHTADATSGSEGAFLEALQILVIKDGLFSLDGGATTINLEDFITADYNAFKLPPQNLNGNFSDNSAIGIWYLSGIAAAQSKTVTWVDTEANKLLKRRLSNTYVPKRNVQEFRIVPPGGIYMGILKNVSSKKAGYAVDAEWSEV